jgi:hypothetical protein
MVLVNLFGKLEWKVNRVDLASSVDDILFSMEAVDVENFPITPFFENDFRWKIECRMELQNSK